MCLGLKTKEKGYLAVWRLKEGEACRLPLAYWRGEEVDVKVAFPADDESCKLSWDSEEGVLEVALPQEGMARIIQLN